jgi:GNAT superfamily N-acetyltransferase
MIDISNIRYTDAWVRFLEMDQAPDFDLPFRPDCRILEMAKPIEPDDYRKLYYGVGRDFYWLDRMVMADEELGELINDPRVSIYRLYHLDQPAGYVEFVNHGEFVEIQYFGLLPGFIGLGLGKYFLRWAVNKAWSLGPRKVQLNTCQLDHPRALGLYLGAGFREVRMITEARKVLGHPG